MAKVLSLSLRPRQQQKPEEEEEETTDTARESSVLGNIGVFSFTCTSLISFFKFQSLSELHDFLHGGIAKSHEKASTHGRYDVHRDELDCAVTHSI